MSGDVVIDPSAVIGAGVILQAAPHCQIKIGAGVCIGMGAILNASQGNVEIEAGVVLGAGVMIIGAGTIGENACVGASTTILETTVAPMQVIAPGSLLGVPGNSPAISTSAHPAIGVSVSVSVPGSDSAEIPPPPAPSSTAVPESEQTTEITSEATSQPENLEEIAQPDNLEENAEAETSEENSAISARVYGQAHVARMMKTLFPYNNFKNQPLNEDDD